MEELSDIYILHSIDHAYSLRTACVQLAPMLGNTSLRIWFTWWQPGVAVQFFPSAGPSEIHFQRHNGNNLSQYNIGGKQLPYEYSTGSRSTSIDRTTTSRPRSQNQGDNSSAAVVGLSCPWCIGKCADRVLVLVFVVRVLTWR
jgi:hypothetical protein